jgi:hypothetical protein
MCSVPDVPSNAETPMNLKFLALAAPVALGVSVGVTPEAKARCTAPHSLGVYCTRDNYNPPDYPDFDFEQYPFGVSPVTVQTSNGEVVFPTGYGIPEISTPDGEPLNVHAGPSFDTPIVGTIANGSALPLTGHIENDDWFETMDGYFIYKHHAR